MKKHVRQPINDPAGMCFSPSPQSLGKAHSSNSAPYPSIWVKFMGLSNYWVREAFQVRAKKVAF
jgi:hypothetical protein